MHNTPMRKLFAMAATFHPPDVLGAWAQPPSAKVPGAEVGFPPKNLQVLDEASFPNAMRWALRIREGATTAM